MNWRVLESVGIDKTLPVTLDLSNLPLGRALDRLLDEVGGPFVRLGYEADGQTITVSTAADVSNDVSTRVYRLRPGRDGKPADDAAVAAIVRDVRGMAPLMWRSTGWPRGAIYVFQGQLVVTQTAAVHARIATELADVLTP